MSTAQDAHGPWSPLHCVKNVEKWEDPCPFWDDETGEAYLGRSRHRAGPIIVHRMSADGRTLLDDGVTVYTGPVAEGTKFLKRNGYLVRYMKYAAWGEGLRISVGTDEDVDACLALVEDFLNGRRD